jgi:UPF0716 protein FxsA
VPTGWLARRLEAVFGIIALLLLVVPIVELYVIVQVAGSVGVLWTIFLLIAVSVVGAILVKHEGTNIWIRAQRQLAQGRMPDNEMIDGVLLLMGGALLLTPGFVTDAVGLLLLFPPTRSVFRSLVKRRFKVKAAAVMGGPASSFRYVTYDAGGTTASSPYADVEEVELRRTDRRTTESNTPQLPPQAEK